jgi:hypothetical protein
LAVSIDRCRNELDTLELAVMPRQGDRPATPEDPDTFPQSSAPAV